MKKFFSFIIRQSVAIILIVVFVLAFGIFSTLKMSVNLLPDINVPMVCVQVIYPGANAQSVEKDVTVKLEDGLSSISGTTCVDSYSYDNLSAVVLSFAYGTDTTEKKTDIQGKISSLDLPDGVTTSVYDIDLNAEALAVLSVTSSNGADEDERLKNAYLSAEAIANKISAIDGVESVEIKGGAESSYVVSPFIGLELISPLLVQAFSYGALDIPLGNLQETANGEKISVQIRNNSDVKSKADIENMPLELPSNLISLFTSVKQVMRYYEDSTVKDLEDLQTDLGSGVLTVLADLKNLSADEVDDLSDLKTYMNIANTYTAQQLTNIKTSRYYSELKKRVINEDGTPKTDEELEDLADDINNSQISLPITVSADLLRVVRDDKIDDIIAFREWLEEQPAYIEANNKNEFYELQKEDYFVLETHR